MSKEYFRPVLKLHYKPIDFIFEFFALAAIIFMWSYCFYHYSSLPKIIPVHFGSDGHADGFVSKKTIFFLPILVTLITLLLRFLNRYPHKFNYMAEITEANAERQYLMATRLIRYLQFILSLLFSYILITEIKGAYAKNYQLGIEFVFLIIAATFVPVVYTVYSSLVKK